MPECDNPLWPCAMTGAAAALAGFEGVAVVIHGSSGCYYYPTTLLHAPLHGTFILENDVIFGSEDRLVEVIGGLAGTGKRIAVITTCVPAILGEDIRSMLAGDDVILVDSPGFSGDIEAGYAKATAAMEPRVDPGAGGVNIEGICLFDPFFSGNLQECRRLFAMASVPVGTVFCKDRFDRVSHASPYTIGTNGDFPSGTGEFLGGTLGFDAIRSTFARIGEQIGESDVGPVLAELDSQEERVVRACDKFLHRFDPPSVAIFAGWSYAEFAAGMLTKYLDADICCIGARNEPGTSSFPVQKTGGLAQVKALIEAEKPDLLIGSSFERYARPAAAFVGMNPPLRGSVRLSPAPLAGINGALAFMEQVLNASMDKKT
jgi:nitrogenase molybdenum-iron protein alpha/beta subunit